MGVEAWECEGALVVSISGELDIATVGEVRGRLDELIGAGWRRLVVDVAELSFCDSVGLGLLVEVGNRCRRRGGRVSVANPRGRVARLLACGGLGDRTPVCDTLGDAVRSTVAAPDADGHEGGVVPGVDPTVEEGVAGAFYEPPCICPGSTAPDVGEVPVAERIVLVTGERQAVGVGDERVAGRHVGSDRLVDSVGVGAENGTLRE